MKCLLLAVLLLSGCSSGGAIRKCEILRKYIRTTADSLQYELSYCGEWGVPLEQYHRAH